MKYFFLLIWTVDQYKMDGLDEEHDPYVHT